MEDALDNVSDVGVAGWVERHPLEPPVGGLPDADTHPLVDGHGDRGMAVHDGVLAEQDALTGSEGAGHAPPLRCEAMSVGFILERRLIEGRAAAPCQCQAEPGSRPMPWNTLFY
jgi:hypothetical protein